MFSHLLEVHKGIPHRCGFLRSWEPASPNVEPRAGQQTAGRALCTAGQQHRAEGAE